MLTKDILPYNVLVRTNKSVRAIIIRDKKILLVHRFKNNIEYWVVPGGGVEDDETLEEALNREVMEETSLKILSHKFLESTLSGGIEHYLYQCRTNRDIATIKEDSPEQLNSSNNNQYILTWVPLIEAKKLVPLFPETAKKFF